MEMSRRRCVGMYIKTRLFMKTHFWNATMSQICCMNHNPYLNLFFRNLTCGRCTRSAAGSSSLQGTAFGNSTRTSSTDVFSEQLSLPFFTITRLFILLCLYLQPKLIPSALLLCYCCFVRTCLISGSGRKLKGESSVFSPLFIWYIWVFWVFLLHGAWMYMSGRDTTPFFLRFA